MTLTNSELWTAPAGTTALIFDCDGTLADTMPAHYLAWTAMLREYQIAFSEQRFYELGGMPGHKIIELLSDESGVAVSDVAVMVVDKENRYLESVEAIQRVEPVCEIAIRYHGVLPMAVASGGERVIVQRTLTTIGMLELFDALVGAEDTVLHKPEPDVFLEAARRIGSEPARCVVFEDTDFGMEAALRAGMTGVDIRPWVIGR
ncbi:MAG: HAD-IA family hydrolase [Ilumatobacteraceae bacterium]